MILSISNLKLMTPLVLPSWEELGAEAFGSTGGKVAANKAPVGALKLGRSVSSKEPSSSCPRSFLILLIMPNPSQTYVMSKTTHFFAMPKPSQTIVLFKEGNTSKMFSVD